MDVTALFNDGMRFITNVGGINIVATKYNSFFNSSDYDDVPTYTLTGSTFISGIIFPVKNKTGSNEEVLLEQGKLKLQDKIFYCGSTNLTGSGLVFNINNSFYSIIEDGIMQYDVAGSTIYHKLYLRNLNGSILF